MKRLGTTLAAAALTGAIAFAGVPASASEGAVPQPETTTLGDRGTNEEDNDGDRGQNEEDDSTRDNNEGETPYGDNSRSRVECADDENATLNIKWGEERPESFEFDGNTWFLHEDGEHYVTDSAGRTDELSEQDQFESDQAAAKKFGYSCDYESSDEGEDGDNDRERTPEGEREKCVTEENSGGNNGDSNNGEGNNGEGSTGDNCETTTLGDRGMNAETGDNTVARTLFALAALSVLGVAAFGARRFFTA
ncbi:hypothetical protein ACG98H_03125 [Corynebacterium sp. L4756]|uniref:hypothetical protein n=1 Tax=unclassified Corynebacterium TaxID=2624378 RepID=UPI00374D7B38